MVRKCVVVSAVLMILILQSQTAGAHKVSLFAYHEEGIVRTEAYFVDGTPCREAKVTATDVEGSIVAEGLTDDEGMFSFPHTMADDLTIVVRASMGHSNEFLLAAAEKKVENSPPSEKKTTVPGLAGVASASGGTFVDEAAIERIVEKKISPIKDSIREIRINQGKPTLGKIIGGLGWIIGLWGAYLWGASRRKEHES